MATTDDEEVVLTCLWRPEPTAPMAVVDDCLTQELYLEIQYLQFQLQTANDRHRAEIQSLVRKHLLSTDAMDNALKAERSLVEKLQEQAEAKIQQAEAKIQQAEAKTQQAEAKIQRLTLYMLMISMPVSGLLMAMFVV
jgi:multidrug resistance efflux pump